MTTIFHARPYERFIYEAEWLGREKY